MKMKMKQLRNILKEVDLDNPGHLTTYDNSGLKDDSTSSLPSYDSAFREVGGHEPAHHDEMLDAALNEYVQHIVERFEMDFGESQSTMMLLETLKGELVAAVEDALMTTLQDVGLGDV